MTQPSTDYLSSLSMEGFPPLFLISGPFLGLLSKLIFEQIPQAVSEVCT